MGTMIIGKCQCQCYINYVSCDYTYQENELKIKKRTNQISEKIEKQYNQIQSSNNSIERHSRFSSTCKPSSRSSSLNSKYLQSSECNIDPDESSQPKNKRKPKINTQFVKSVKSYNFEELSIKNQSAIHEQQIIEQKTSNPLVLQIVQANRPLNYNGNKEEKYEYRPFKKANKYQQLFFK